jgi:predicted Zn-dependent protease
MTFRQTRLPGTCRGAAARPALAALFALAVAAPQPLCAQGGPTIIRDAEIEALLAEYARPIFQAAGMQTGAVKIIIVGDMSFNAFVANGRKIFINTGALLDAKTPNEVIGVLAHETGHIAGGHLARLRQQLDNAQLLAVAGMLLGGAAAVAVSTSRGNVGTSGTGMYGVMTGPTELVRRNLLAYQRGEEQAADRAALRYLEIMRQSPRGMIETFRRFGQSGMFASRALDPYLLSHPLPQERIANLQDAAQKSPYLNAKDAPALQARHDMMRAKIAGFMSRPDTVSRMFGTDSGSLAARYATAISNFRNGRPREALGQIDALIRARPNYPYFWELKGQALLESGRAAEAIVALRKASALAPASALLKIMLGHALVASENAGNLDEAIRVLTAAAARDPDAAEAYRHLATAYGRKGDIGMAELSSARYYFSLGAIKDAQNQAHRAKQKLKPGTPAYLKADDILAYVPPALN